VQESLTNVVKHTEASRVLLNIRRIGGGICMEAVNNGKSYRPGPEYSAHARKRLGLLGMQQRVRLVNGQFTVKAEPGKGTTVHVVIPLIPKSVLTPSRRDRSGRNDACGMLPPLSRHSVREP
jgi:signal transduction histidine kinase